MQVRLVFAFQKKFPFPLFFHVHNFYCRELDLAVNFVTFTSRTPKRLFENCTNVCES